MNEQEHEIANAMPRTEQEFYKMTSKEFFRRLEDGREYVTLITTKEIYNSQGMHNIPEIVLTSIKKKNESFENDETYRELVSAVSKAKKKLRDYEFSINNQ